MDEYYLLYDDNKEENMEYSIIQKESGYIRNTFSVFLEELEKNKAEAILAALLK